MAKTVKKIDCTSDIIPRCWMANDPGSRYVIYRRSTLQIRLAKDEHMQTR